jgi:hypothetical protein
VLVVATLVQNLVKDNEPEPAPVELEIGEPQGSFFARWGKRCGSFSGALSRFISWRFWCWGRRASGCSRMRMALSIIRCCGYCDGDCRLPVCDPNGGGNPDCADHDAGWHGNRGAGAAYHLPAISLPSLIMLRKSFPAKALWLTAGLVALSGVIVGCIALI